MAYAALTSLAQTTDQILNHDQYPYSSLLGKGKIKSIYDHAIFLQAFLEDSPEKANSLEGQIRDVANEAEDIIECFVWDQIRSSYVLTVPDPFNLVGKYTQHYLNFFNDLKIVTGETDLIAGEMTGINDSFRIKQQLDDSPASTSSPIPAPTHEDVMIGFDNDLMAIKSRLCGESSQLQVILIFGIEGIGKTTLARNVYDDPLIMEYFNIRAWISEQEFPDILLMFLEETNAERLDCNVEWLSYAYVDRESNEKVIKRLRGMRYLIVMDDIRSTKAWDVVRNIFPDDNNGSRIMLTTRQSNVAAYHNPCSSIYEMCFMDEDQSWNLLRHKAFANKDCPPELENIGKEIARSCRGWPVAIVVSAGLLATVSKNPASWAEIAENVHSVVAAKDGQFEEILSLSYTHLPYHLRPCFLYLGGFLKDHEVCVSKLIKLWIATIQNIGISTNNGYPHRAQLGYQIHDLEKATEKIKSIAEQVEQVMFINNSFRIKDEQQLCDSPVATSSPKLAPKHKDDMIGCASHATSSSQLAPAHKDVMTGFDDDLMAIKSRLCGESSQLQVIPIFGMGGIGKTALARKAYDDPLILEYFHIRAWVTISQVYSVQEIIASLLVSMEGFKEERSGQSNEEKVYKSLKGKRYLIVTDDMWSTKAWDDVRNIFPDDNNGSRIMLTTRLLDVAGYPNLYSSIYEMPFMDENQSWNLLRHKVFTHQDCPPELENIGKEIARSCGGLSLAIVVIGGLLSTVSKNPTSWKEIAENVNSVVATKDGQFEEILSLSYTHLPHHLRPCFLYMGGFPEDHEIRVSKLIKLWVAEGFLKCPNNGSKSFEEEAEECLENLVNRSLVLVTKRKSNGKIKSCSLHDLMRDLCIRKANEEKFLANIRDGYAEKGLLNQRRMSIAFPGPPYLLRTYGSAIHTIMWFLYTSLPSLESFRLLRVLDAGDADVKSILAQLFELFHLRYLAINCPGRIPAAILKLQNLQTLIIRARGRWKLDEKHEDCLPQEIWRMPQLRHLFFCGRLPNPGRTTSTLGNLQILCFSLSHYMIVEGILRMIPNLKKLKINCYNSQGGAYLNNLLHLQQLENLELRSYSIHAVWRKDDFTFPRTLQKLTLSGLRLSWNEMTAVCSLPNLQVLKLKDHACRDSTWETTEGECLKLEYLLIEKSYLRHWITESSHFPRLKFLLIHACWRLSEIPDGIGEIPTLELIEVKGHVKKSLVESAKKIQEEQQDLGNDALQVRCITH